MSEEQILFIQQAENKALATEGPEGLNVVPVSTVRVIDGNIILFNFFMEKGARNLAESDFVALAVWSGESGIQVKGSMRYEYEGGLYQELKEEVEAQYPGRTVHAIIIISPEEVYNLSLPGALVIE